MVLLPSLSSKLSSCLGLRGGTLGRHGLRLCLLLEGYVRGEFHEGVRGQMSQLERALYFTAGSM